MTLLRAHVGTAAHESEERCPSEYAAEVTAARFRRAFYQRSAVERRRLDHDLQALEACRGFEPGLIRLMRLHYLSDCAEPLAQAALPDESVSPALRWALRGMATKARISQWRATARKPLPRIRPHEQSADLRKKVAPWMAAQGRLLEQAQALVAELPPGSYGRGIAELELSALAEETFEARSQAALTAHSTLAAQSSTDASLPALRAVFNGDDEPLLALAGKAAGVVSLVADWQQIGAWWPPPRLGYWDLPQAVLLPPSERSLDLQGEERVLALLPSYIAARVLPLQELGLAELSALAVAGWDPLLRRSVTARPPEAAITRLLTRERLKLMLRSFDPAQASAAAELARFAYGKDEPIALLSTALAQAPSGADAWRRAQSLPGAELLLRRAADPQTSVLDRAWLVHDAVRLAGPNVSSVLAGFPGLTLTTGDSSFPWCHSGFISEKPCSCPSLLNL